MRKSFGAARRVPRKVGQDDDDDAGATSSGTDAGGQTPGQYARPLAFHYTMSLLF